MTEATAPPIESRRVVRGRPRLLVSSLFLVALAAVIVFGIGWWLGIVHPSGLRLVWSEPYALAQHFVRDDTQIAAHLGEVAGFGWLPRGDIQVEGREGWCELEMTVRGAKGVGHFESRLVRHGGTWFWEWANVRLEDGTLVTLAVP